MVDDTTDTERQAFLHGSYHENNSINPSINDNSLSHLSLTSASSSHGPISTSPAATTIATKTSSSPSKPDDSGGNTTTTTKVTSTKVVLLNYIILHSLQLVNILLWYYTNGMNGIAMQSFAKQIVVPTVSTTESYTLRFWWTFQITCYVTYRQLLLGSMIGYGILVTLLMYNHQTTFSQSTSAIIELVRTSQWWPLTLLHSVGSLATNVGFMYGKASVIQVIKLLEPFETLLLSQLLFRAEGKCTVGIISSMSVVVGAAMSLLKLQSTPPVPHAVIAAVISGITLSCRNVLQRKHHHQHSSTSGSTNTSSSQLPSASSHRHIATDSKTTTTTSATTTTTISTLSKLEKSVLQFTQLSFFCGLSMWCVSFLLWCIVVAPTTSSSSTTSSTSAKPDNIQVFLWHPLYNVFSMITLGFCSALTHSLLNAGKRVFAIIMAMIWFQEGFNHQTMLGLICVGIGGSWYSAESKGAASAASTSGTNSNRIGPGIKLATAAVLLTGLMQFQSTKKQKL